MQRHIHDTKVYVGGIPQDAREDAIREHFSKFGTVSELKINFKLLIISG